MEETDLKDREKFLIEQDKKRAKEQRESQVFRDIKHLKNEGNDVVNTGSQSFIDNRNKIIRNRNFNSNT